jgi:hypothetical protein
MNPRTKTTVPEIQYYSVLQHLNDWRYGISSTYNPYGLQGVINKQQTIDKRLPVIP